MKGGIKYEFVATPSEDTAIRFDTKSNTYLMPIKAAVRKSEKVAPCEEITITV